MTAVYSLSFSIGVIAIFSDLHRRIIPNWLTIAGCLAGLACAASMGWRSFGIALSGAAAGFLLLLPLQLLGAIGGGDVKLLAAYGTLLGPAGILSAAVFGAIFGGAWALCAGLRGARAIPYAPAIVAGAWVVLVGGGL
jgi:prepilin peptidase CpaA